MNKSVFVHWSDQFNISVDEKKKLMANLLPGTYLAMHDKDGHIIFKDVVANAFAQLKETNKLRLEDDDA